MYLLLLAASISLSCNFIETAGNSGVNSSAERARQEMLKDWFRSATLGDYHTIRFYVQNTPLDINSKQDISGYTALMWAAIQGSKLIVDFLLKVPGIDVNAQDLRGHTALMSTQDENIAKLLLDAPGIDVNIQNHDGDTALFYAIQFQRDNIARLLLQAPGIKINTLNKAGKTVLMYAIEQKRYSIVPDIVNAGINVNFRAKGISAIVAVALGGQEDLVKLLLQLPHLNLNVHENLHHFKTLQGRYPAIAQLIKDKVDDLIRQAFEAISEHNLDKLKLIVSQIGVDDIDDAQGNTLLDRAFIANQPKIIEFLLQQAHNPRALLERFPFEFISPTSEIFNYCMEMAYSPLTQEDKTKLLKESGEITEKVELPAQLSKLEIEKLMHTVRGLRSAGFEHLKKQLFQTDDPRTLLELITFEINPTSELFHFLFNLAYSPLSEKDKENLVKETRRKLKIDTRLNSCARCAKIDVCKICSGCKLVYYCSTECQKCDWAKHKTQCRRS